MSSDSTNDAAVAASSRDDAPPSVTRRSLVTTALKGLAGSLVLITTAAVTAPSEANACQCGQNCCSGSPVVQ